MTVEGFNRVLNPFQKGFDRNWRDKTVIFVQKMSRITSGSGADSRAGVHHAEQSLEYLLKGFKRVLEGSERGLKGYRDSCGSGALASTTPEFEMSLIKVRNGAENDSRRVQGYQWLRRGRPGWCPPRRSPCRSPISSAPRTSASSTCTGVPLS